MTAKLFLLAATDVRQPQCCATRIRSCWLTALMALAAMAMATLTLDAGAATANDAGGTYSVSITVSGLAGSGLEVGIVYGGASGGSGSQLVDANGTFSFDALPNGTTYNVSVLQQPSNPTQVCDVTNGSGTISGASVSNVGVTCTTYYTVGGTVSGLAAGSSVELGFGYGYTSGMGGGGSSSQTISANGPFSFDAVPDGSTWSVSVDSQPANGVEHCSVANGSGTISHANVTNIVVTCGTNTTTTLNATPTQAPLGTSIQFVASVTGQIAITALPSGREATAQGNAVAAAIGSVTFYEGATALGSAPVNVDSGGNATASLAVSTLAVGTHSVTAQYSGDPATSRLGSTSAPVSVTVTAAVAAPAASAPALDRWALLLLAMALGGFVWRQNRGA